MGGFKARMQPGVGWMSRDAAAVVYDLTEREMVELAADLKRSGATCATKGFEISSLDRAVAAMRGQD